jgi:hypothetical protein
VSPPILRYLIFNKNCGAPNALATVVLRSQAAPFACFLRNTSLKSVKPDCDLGSSSLRGGTRWLM